MAERMIEANGVELCTEAFGDPADPPILLDHGHRRVDALVGGGLLPDARRRRAVRDPLRPPRHRPIGDLRAGPPRIHGRRPGRRRSRRARRLRDPGRAPGRRLGGRGVRAAARAGPRRSRPLARAHQHLSRDARWTASSRHRPRRSGGSWRPRRWTGRTRVGDRVPGRLLARARGRPAPVRRGGGSRARAPRRRARPRLRRCAEPRRCSRTTRRRASRCPRSPPPPW